MPKKIQGLGGPRKEFTEPPQNILSFRAEPAQDRFGRSRLTPTDTDDFVHSVQAMPSFADADHSMFIRSCGLLPCGLTSGRRHAEGVSLGGLVPASPSAALGGLPLSSSDFVDFRDSGPRVDIHPQRPSRNVMHVRSMGPAVSTGPSPIVTCDRPPLVSSDPLDPFLTHVFEVEGTVPTTPPSTSARPTLDPTSVVSTRTRRKTAAASGAPRPAVNYGFDQPDNFLFSSLPSVPEDRAESSPTLPLVASAPVGLPESVADPAPLPAPQPIAHDTSSEPPVTPPSGPLLGSSLTSAITSEPRRDDAALSPIELDFRESVEWFSHSDWAREQHKEPECEAAIRYIQLGQPKVLPLDFFDGIPSSRRPSFIDVRELAYKGRLFVDDDDVMLLVRKSTAPPSSSRPVGRVARLLNDERTRSYLRSYVDAPLDHASLPCQCFVPFWRCSHA